MESSDLQMVSFDEEQIFAVGRALMAVADEVYETPKFEPISYEPEEVIELLSDSENGENGVEEDTSDCEIFGQMCSNIELAAIDTVITKDHPEENEVYLNEAVVECPDQATNDTTSINITKENNQESVTSQVGLSAIIELDDDDDSTCNNGIDADNINANKGGFSEEEVKEKKCVNLLDYDSDDNNEPSASKHLPRNCHNLEAFLNYLCPQCGVSCCNKKKWNAHTDIVHNFRSIDKLNLKTVISRQGQLFYQCKSCEKKFNSDCSHRILLNHRIQHMTIPQFLRCRLCEERFSSRMQFLKHFKSKHRKIALEKLRRSESFRKHIIFACPVCKKKTANMKSWMSHLESAHDWYNKLEEKVTTLRINLVECKSCLATFRSNYVKWHSLRHEENKPFNCKFCKKFKSFTFGPIINHIRVEHFNEKFEQIKHCYYCDETFANFRQRSDHMIEMHTIERLTCEVCEKKYTSSARLLAHMAKFNHQKIK
uniref:Zinc finger and BTB domain-containing protein 48 n=1 Tax=Ceratitis capitata TaxID=7213 RepID=W8CB02_CERCA